VLRTVSRTWLRGVSPHRILKKITGTACHASAPLLKLRWSQVVFSRVLVSAFRSFSSAGRGHTMVRQGVPAYSAAIAEACNV
jgi:hypothetical protein